jgi:hypothetical protein
MNYAKIIFVIILAVTFRSVYGQNKVVFTYDANGSRLSRKLEIVGLKSSAITFPVDLTKLEEIDLSETIQIRIFPNPVASSLKLVISGYEESTKKDGVIFNVSGAEILRFQSLSNECEIQLSGLDYGVYILRLTIDSEIFVYKILKTN